MSRTNRFKGSSTTSRTWADELLRVPVIVLPTARPTGRVRLSPRKCDGCAEMFPDRRSLVAVQEGTNQMFCARCVTAKVAALERKLSDAREALNKLMTTKGNNGLP
jgi:ferredoxin